MTKNNLFEFDKNFNEGFVIGTDEAGRGPGAGGVFASAVYFPNPDDELIKQLSDLNDSKKLSKKKREELYEIILQNSINLTVCVEVEEIEKINILNASLKAMKLAVENVMKQICSGQFTAHSSQFTVLVDGNKKIRDFNYPQKTIVKGDSKSASIAAASILAKVSRDRYMAELHEKFPQYNWVQNAGYLTKEHLSAIDKYGITPLHRKKFLRKHKEKCIKQLSMFQK
ncbi:MAG TPA: ribonuclease HII [Candidatus Gastranaerophilaceae bacterium]|nr:ribonuclease HII [Candidatus Gastranaerophilaceae bacterium]